MAVFPESMNLVNPSDSEGSIRTIDEYIRYACQRIEFAIGTVTKQVSSVGIISTIEIIERLSALEQQVTRLNAITSAQSIDIRNIKEAVAGINEAVIQINASIESLDDRVTKLENPTPPVQP